MLRVGVALVQTANSVQRGAQKLCVRLELGGIGVSEVAEEREM